MYPWVFFNVFRQTSKRDEELGPMNDFLLNVAPWEIKQIAIVQEFLYFQVSPSKSLNSCREDAGQG
jgi:hypothetical protein